MTVSSTDTLLKLASRSGLSCEINANGSLRRMSCGDTTINLFLGNEVEGGPANLYLRRRRGALQYIELLGPRSPTHFQHDAEQNAVVGTGEWQGIRYSLALTLAEAAPAWFWHLSLENIGNARQELDLIYAQDIALAPYGTVRLNEYYVSQYVDHTALSHEARGYVVASRQNLSAGGRNPWSVIGSLRRGLSYATDALQVHGLASRAGEAPVGVIAGLPGRRLQHEHSMVAIQDEPLRLEPGERHSAGFFGALVLDHPAATGTADLDHVDQVLALPVAPAPTITVEAMDRGRAETLFSAARLLAALDLDAADCASLFGADRRHEEFDERGQLLSFFHGADRHVVLRAKELRVQRPHGHLLRTGRHAAPDETALTSTPWMSGVFHSMLTQGHVSINRCLSTVHGYLGLFRSHGQRVFVEVAGNWQLLDVPSAFEMVPEECRWIYKHAAGLIEVRSRAHTDPHELSLTLDVRAGEPTRFLISHHVALNGDDGSVAGLARWTRDDQGVAIAPAEGTELARRFPSGYFHVAPIAATNFETVGGDELLFADGRSRHQPYVCIITASTRFAGLRLRGHLILESVDVPSGNASAIKPVLEPALQMQAPAASNSANAVARLADIVPWFVHNALIHYLSPRGLEQYSGGGWGTRDVSQGPVELLLALGHTTPVRELLIRVLSAQQPDGDWPQWFMFFERDRDIRAGDSHGDIVFWPVLALAQYLIASGDGTLLDQPVPFFQSQGAESAEHATVWQHIERALQVIEQRVIAGTALAAYGHGDWNDALQPADPAMREHMCSAWTVTLHHQTLVTLARALRVIGRSGEASRLETWAVAVQSDFQRLLLIDGVLTGYALFESSEDVRYLLHPRDTTTGVRYSVLAMIHAILEDMLTPAQARAHLDLIERHLSGPDGARLFDRPMPYHGGPQRLFQRAESATFFGREIGLMYMHAHLRYAQALAHMGEADRFFRALCQANPIGIQAVVPTASLRQANCYYSSSDAAFADRYQASTEYQRVRDGTIALDGGWRIYSSGAGIAFSLIIRRFLGLSFEHETLVVDPVIPASLDGLRVRLTLFGRPVEVTYGIQAAGCAVSSVEINDQPLPLTHAPNPFRKGAARMPVSELTRRLKEAGNMLRINVG
jgi:1,2-beta-oligoglucan phosphorylase